MPQDLSRRSALLLVAVAFAVTLGVGLLLAGGPSVETPRPSKLSAQSIGADAPAAEPDLRLVETGSVPALREPRRPRARKPKPAVEKVTRVAPTVRTPVQPAAPVPTPTATPRYIPPTPPPSAPAPKPKPKPAPTTAPPATGEFDTSGEEP